MFQLNSICDGGVGTRGVCMCVSMNISTPCNGVVALESSSRSIELRLFIYGGGAIEIIDSSGQQLCSVKHEDTQREPHPSDDTT